MSTRPAVSIMIPAHKPLFLERTLCSALAQDWPALEILISDDSESPEVAAVVKRHEADPRIRYSRHPAPSGITSNYHRLIELAEGDWGLFLDDDDELYAGAIATLVQLAVSGRERVLVYAGYDLTDLRTGARRRVCVGRDILLRPGREFFLRFTEIPPVTVAVLFSVRAARAANVFRGEQNIKSGDWEAWLMIALRGDVAYLPEALGCHYRHDQGYSAIPSLEMDIANASFIDAAARYARARGDFSARELTRWRRRVRRWYLTWIFATYIPECEQRELLRHFGRLLRHDPWLALAIAANPALALGLLLSPWPPLHRAARGVYRRVRFGRTGTPNF
jgi:glycosyltransferase involved in cell wall biosynthesis